VVGEKEAELARPHEQVEEEEGQGLTTYFKNKLKAVPAQAEPHVLEGYDFVGIDVA